MAIKSDAQRRAVSKYISEHYDQFVLRLPKGRRDEYKKSAKEMGYESLTQFCVDAIEEKIERGR